MTWALHRAGCIHFLTHYLNDFLFPVPPQYEDGSGTLCLARSVFATLGVQVAKHKTEGPSSVSAFLGTVIDTAAGEQHLPKDKFERLQDLIMRWNNSRAMYEERIGVLHRTFMSCCYCGGTFLRALFQLLHYAKKPHHFVRLTTGAWADIMWWKCLLGYWSAHSFSSHNHSHNKYSQIHQVPGGVVNFLHLWSDFYGFEFEAIHILGSLNGVADASS